MHKRLTRTNRDTAKKEENWFSLFDFFAFLYASLSFVFLDVWLRVATR